MKFLLILSFLFLISLSLASNQNALEKILNVDDNPNCRGDCKTLKKVLSTFPLKGDEQALDSQLNFFNWKFFYVFSDHFSVYKATQTDPVRGKLEAPLENDFLNNFPIDFIQTPCNNYRDLCTVNQFRDQIYKPIKKEFTTNTKAMDSMGKELWNNCILITQDLLEDPANMNYICSKNVEDLQAIIRISNEMINKYEGKEFVGRLYMLNDNHDDIVELNAHLNSELFLGNNVNDCIEDGKKLPDYKEFFSYTFMNEMVSPSYPLLKENLEVPWKGDASKKPEKERCFSTPLLVKNGREKKDQYFCVFTNDNGTLKLSPQDSNLIVVEWVTRLNRRLRFQKVRSSEEILKNIDGDIPTNSPQLEVAKDEVHNLAIKVDQDCQEKVKAGILNQRNCDEMKMKIIVEKSNEMCGGNKNCLKAIKQCVKEGLLPIVNTDSKDAVWNPDNPYKSDPKVAIPTTTLANDASNSQENPITSSSEKPLTDKPQTPSLLDKLQESQSDSQPGKDKGDTVVSTFGKEKAEEILKKELSANEINGVNQPTPKISGETPEAKQTNERVEGILKDIGLTTKELEKMKKQENTVPPTEEGQPAPSKEEIQKAINSFKRIFYGRIVDKIDGVEKYCVSAQKNMGRTVGILPFVARFDPWLEYLGGIRDSQLEKK